MSDIKARRGVSRGIKVMNTSDLEQTVLYNSRAYTFKPGEVKEIEGQMDVIRDEFGRPTEEAMANRRMEANKHATAELVADHLVKSGRSKGLCLIMGDSTDAGDMTEARKDWIRDITVKDKAIEARWRQKCLDSKNAGAGIPPMPANVEEAQDRLIKYRSALVEANKRFVVTVDGRSFHTKAEAKRHIISRYPSEGAEWESLVNDTIGSYLPEEEVVEKDKALKALQELADKTKKEKE